MNALGSDLNLDFLDSLLLLILRRLQGDLEDLLRLYQAADWTLGHQLRLLVLQNLLERLSTDFEPFIRRACSGTLAQRLG